MAAVVWKLPFIYCSLRKNITSEVGYFYLSQWTYKHFVLFKYDLATGLQENPANAAIINAFKNILYYIIIDTVL